jgi:hypothetical protein
VFGFAQTDKSHFHGSVSKLYPRWTQVFATTLLHKKDYEAPPEDLVEQAKARFTAVLNGELQELVRLLRDVFRPAR